MSDEPFFKAEDFESSNWHSANPSEPSILSQIMRDRAEAKVQPLLDRLASAEEALELLPAQERTRGYPIPGEWRDLVKRGQQHFERWKK